MQIKVEKFCSLATSSSWQNWLYKYNIELYRKFISRLQLSRNCNTNKDIMTDILNDISNNGGLDSLHLFLSKKHQSMLVDDSVSVDYDEHGVFNNFVPGVLTFPHRVIFRGSDLEIKVRSFMESKGKSDYIIIEDTAYVEYLYKSEDHLVGLIPDKNWLIKKYKMQR